MQKEELMRETEKIQKQKQELIQLIDEQKDLKRQTES